MQTFFSVHIKSKTLIYLLNDALYALFWDIKKLQRPLKLNFIARKIHENMSHMKKTIKQ